MVTLKKQLQHFPDLFLQERSATKRLSTLLTPQYHKCSLEELRNKGIEILNLNDTIVSPKKKQEYLFNFDKQTSKIMFQIYITNIVMKGSNLSMT